MVSQTSLVANRLMVYMIFFAAAFYELRYAVENLTSLLQDFSSNAMIQNFNLTTGNLSSPKEAGSTETFIFDAPLPNKTEKVL